MPLNFKLIINNAIWSVIIQVISKLNEHAAQVQFEITSMISDQNCTILSSIATLLLTSIFDRFSQYQYFIDPVISLLKAEPETL